MKNKKIMVIMACSALILVFSLAGTLAYLTDITAPVTNTFTIGKLLNDPLNFVLKEHKAKDDAMNGLYSLDTTKEVESNAYTVLPGVNLPKDPFVKTNETLKLDAYVFIEVVDETGSNLHFTVDSDNWTKLAGQTGPNGGDVYVMAENGGIVEAGDTLGPIYILKDNKIVVDNAEITDADAQFGGNVVFYGYMIQAGGFDDSDDAWMGISGSTI